MLLKPEVLAALNKQIAHEASSEKAADYGTCAWLNKPDGLILEAKADLYKGAKSFGLTEETLKNLETSPF